MKDYFIRLFKYDQFANQVILQTMQKANNPDIPVKLMAHLLAAQQVWINRCKYLLPPTLALWPDLPADTLTALVAQNSADWLNYLDTLQADDFEKLITYQNSRGDSFENKLCDLLGHVINHGTHHRAQAGQHLKAAGIENLPGTDYIMFLRMLDLRQ